MAQEEQLSQLKKLRGRIVIENRPCRHIEFMEGEYLEEDKSEVNKTIKSKGLTSYADLFEQASKKFPNKVWYQLQRLGKDQAEVNKVTQARLKKEGLKRLHDWQQDHKYFKKEDNPYLNFRFHQNHDCKGMDNAVYWIRVGGVSEKNLSKFDDLYLEVTAFFRMLEHRHRPLNDKESKKVHRHLKQAQQQLRSAKRNMVSTEDQFIQNKHFSFMATNQEHIRDVIFKEIDTINYTIDDLILINQREQEFGKIHPNDTTILQYFFFLSWKMYALLEEKTFQKKKNYNQDFGKFTHLLLRRFVKFRPPPNKKDTKDKWQKTYDSIRDNYGWKKLKRLNLHHLMNPKDYNKTLTKLFT